ncbi:hypothetical protein [Dongia sp.]|uniref:hypothetical protein n=1 Tax=Dongia sp. TaxID=1977262 RepID=UPI0035ADE2F5
MTTLFVDGRGFLVGEEYREGALAQRSGQARQVNPHAMSDRRHDHWNHGFDHEQSMLHVLDGVDLITDRKSYSRVFSTTAISINKTSRAHLKYSLDLMRASGMLEESRNIFATRGPLSPGDLMLALRANGHSLSRMFAETIIERLRVEREMRGAALTNKETDIVGKLSASTKHFLIGLGMLQDRYFDKTPTAELISAFFNKPMRWPVSVARVMKREKQDFLIEIGHNRIKLSPKGWAAIELLRSQNAKPEEDRAYAAA